MAEVSNRATARGSFRDGHTKFTARLQVVHMISLQMAKYGVAMTKG
jgi:hypothetical protein